MSQLRTQRKWRHTEHHSSFFLFHLLRNIRAGRQTCFGFDQRETFSMSLCWAENVQQSLLPVRTTKEDTVRQNCDVLGHNKDFSVSPFCSASVRNGIDSAHSECQSAWTQFLTDEVCLSLSQENEATCDYTAEPGLLGPEPRFEGLLFTFQRRCAVSV